MVSTDLRDHLQLALASAYTFERELGGGGMSRVFVADDTALGRKVVVKVLRTELVEGLSAERFQREIRLAARLQHPHIVPLLSAGELPGGVLYYTMPLVEGETLRERLEREGNLPVAEVTWLLRDVAGALAYAHRQRVIHRDIKPENVLLADGGAVVTDFGIAKALAAAVGGGLRAERDSAKDLSPERAESATHPSTLTAAGVSLGTPAYMAPEQATGDAVDHRADLYALGVVAYEMLAGRPPFDDRTAQRLLAAHVTEAPEPVAKRRSSTPPALAALVMRLLEKNPADRPQSADEVLRALDEAAVTSSALHTSDASFAAVRPTAAGRRAGWRARLLDPAVVALALAAAGVGAAIGWAAAGARSEPGTPRLRARFAVNLPADARVNPTGPGYSIDVSPDGYSVVYVGGAPDRRLYVWRFDSLTPRPLAGTESAAYPRYSPDGRWIGFGRGLTVYKVPVGGGPVVRVTAGEGRFAWGPDGSIVFRRAPEQGIGLWRVSASGVVEPITGPDSALPGNHTAPIVLPDGNTVLFTLSTDTGSTLAAVRLSVRRVVPLGLPGGSPAYLADGYLVFASQGNISAVRFDAARLRVIGEPVTMVEGVTTKPSGAVEYAVAPSGTLAYLPGAAGRDLVEVDRRGGGTRVVLPSGRGTPGYGNPRISPDGRRIALSAGRPPFERDVWVHDIASGTLTRLTNDGRSGDPTWTPDGRRVAWTSTAPGREGIWWQPWNAGARPELLVPDGRGAEFTPEGDAVLASVRAAGGGRELRLVPLPGAADRRTRTLPTPSAVEGGYRISQDGRWLAYLSEETGTRELYIRPFPGPGGRFQISSGGAAQPVWARGGKELIYRGGAALISATLATSPEPTVLRRDTLFRSNEGGPFDVTRDGSRFVMPRLATTTASPVVVLGWADEVRERLRAAAAK